MNTAPKNDSPADILEMAAAVQTHQRSAMENVEAVLKRAATLQEKWRVFIAVMPELARRQAEEVDQRVAKGERLPLAGVPFAVKDLLDVAGVATTCGSRAFANRMPTTDATAVRKLVQAGAVLVGKTNLHECAFGFTGENAHYGDCKNPWDAERITGGSSSGSAAAVALGICPLTLGSDTGGSIRHPSALCGVTGLKPTYGRVSRAGGVPLSWSLDHVGPIVRTAREAAVALQALAGHDPADETSSRRPAADYSSRLDQSLKGLRLGVCQAWFMDDVDPQVAAAIEVAIEQLLELGAQRVDVKLPLMEEALGAHRAIIFAEAASYYRPYLASDLSPMFADDIRPLLAGGLFLSAAEYLKAQRARRVIRAAWAKEFQAIDCLLTPTSPIVATRFGEHWANLPRGKKPLLRAYLDQTLPFNLSGQPAMSVPCGFSQEGLPIGLQLVGRPFAEATLLRVAHQYQQITSWHKRLPPAAQGDSDA